MGGNMLFSFILITFLPLTKGFRCECGVFVDYMYPGLSDLEPLNWLAEGSISGECSLGECRTHCTNAAQNFDYSLDIVQDGRPRGTLYCEQIDDLYGGGNSIDFDNEQQVVISKMPDCENFFVWDTNRVHTTGPQLCCQGRTWC